ncbi:MAG: hypothetical protein RSC24_06610 [Clostridium sp.]
MRNKLNLTSYDDMGVVDYNEFVKVTKGKKIKFQYLMIDSVDVSDEEMISTLESDKLIDIIRNISIGFVDMLEEMSSYIIRNSYKDEEEDLIVNEFRILDVV